jgi:flagellar capping protein FliD
MKKITIELTIDTTHYGISAGYELSKALDSVYQKIASASGDVSQVIRDTTHNTIGQVVVTELPAEFRPYPSL